MALKFLMSCDKSVEVVLALATNVSAQNKVDWGATIQKLREGCGSSRKVVGLIWSMRASQFALFGTQAARRKRRRQEDYDVTPTCSEGRDVGVSG